VARDDGDGSAEPSNLWLMSLMVDGRLMVVQLVESSSELVAHELMVDGRLMVVQLVESSSWWLMS
jgi:hypothetical protein